MPNEPPDPGQVAALRATVSRFIGERLAPKLEAADKAIEKETDPEKRAALAEKRQGLLHDHAHEVWLENAANRVGQIQLVTHALKYTHPNARGSSIHCTEPPALSDEALVGTHTVGGARADDVVGNAAALDVYKFLKVEHQGRTLLARIAERDHALAAALSDDPERATQWMERFAAITRSPQPPASHKLAKQVYFPLPTGDYHLLAPLFPTSLVHAVHAELRRARFSEESKLARQARRDQAPHPRGYHEYPNLAVQVFGGTKPQNVSQLNSERYGEAWLLSSAPPIWRTRTTRPPLHVETVFGRRFGTRPAVKELTAALAEFLSGTDYNNLAIRRTRAALVDRIIDQVLHYAAELAELAPGWSADPECRLHEAERLWLDPGRAESDEAFAALRAAGDWRATVAGRFGNWLNRRLRDHSRRTLPLGSAEHAEWMETLEEELAYV